MVLVGDGVEPPLLELLIDQMVAHVERDEEIGLLVELLQHVDLIHGRWSTLDHPTVRLAIRHVESLPQELHDKVVRDLLTILDELPQFLALGVQTLPSDVVFDHLVDIDVDQFILL